MPVPYGPASGVVSHLVTPARTGLAASAIRSATRRTFDVFVRPGIDCNQETRAYESSVRFLVRIQLGPI